MNEMINPQTKEALKAVLKKASSDEDFRQKCISNPNAAIKEAAGIEVPTGVEIKFVEPGSAIVVTLPPLGSGEAELDEQVLAAVAAGGGAGASTKSVSCFAST
jgi:hypothetical protein